VSGKQRHYKAPSSPALLPAREKGIYPSPRGERVGEGAI